MDKQKILLVDDVQLFLEEEKTFFDRDDFEMLLASTGNEALSIVRVERPDLVFMDLYMPDMDGDKCCYAIKSDEELRSTPVIMVTRGVDEEDFERCWRAGCDDIIVKPINRHYFLAVTNKFLKMRQRKATRFVARLRVQYGRDQETLLTDYSINLSTGGVFIETSNLLPLDTPLTIKFVLSENETSVSCEGRVAWLNHPDLIRNRNLPIGMGLQFMNISLGDMNIIRQFMKTEGLLPFW